jgi:inhibitor of the pro-sigma K processing machinery
MIFEVIILDFNICIEYLAGLCILFILCRIFIVPIKFILKLVVNSLFGGIILFIINYIGSFCSFHIGLNLFTIIFVSILGIPRSYTYFYNSIANLILFLYL